MWSLQIELIAVPLILLAFLGSVRWGLILAVMLFLVLAALSFSGAWNRAIGGSGMLGTIHAFIPGMIAFWIGHRLVERCPVRLAPALFLALLVGFVASRPVLGWTSNWSPLAEAAFGAAIVAFLAFSPVGAAGRVFDLGVVRFFGRVSYSFYLLHPLSLMIMWNIPETLGAIIRSGVPAFVVHLDCSFYRRRPLRRLPGSCFNVSNVPASPPAVRLQSILPHTFARSDGWLPESWQGRLPHVVTGESVRSR